MTGAYCLVTEITIGVWTALALFGYAFQCELPHWQYLPSRCAGEVSKAGGGKGIVYVHPRLKLFSGSSHVRDHDLQHVG